MHSRALVALSLIAVLALASSAEARCRPVSLPDEVSRVPFVVEAVVERAGDPAQFRTVSVWKGGARAPARFSLSARRGRGYWPWHEPQNVGHRYLLMLNNTGHAYSVMRCGVTGEITDARRSELRAQGLRPHPEAGASPGGDGGPTAVVEALFLAARSREFGPLAQLCDPSGEGDGDTRSICALGSDPSRAEPFVEAFRNGRVTGPPTTRGNQASVPILFGPRGDRPETIALVRRSGRWYLSSF